MNSFHKYYRWVDLRIVTIIKLFECGEIILPATQAEVSDKYVNLFAAGTFSIWAVIYIGMALTISIDFTVQRAFRALTVN